MHVRTAPPPNRKQRRHPDSLPPPDLLTIPETAVLLRRSADSLYRLVRAGKFQPAVRVGGHWLISVPKLKHVLHGEGDAA